MSGQRYVGSWDDLIEAPAAPEARSVARSMPYVGSWDDLTPLDPEPMAVVRPRTDAAGMATDDLETQARASAVTPLQARPLTPGATPAAPVTPLERVEAARDYPVGLASGVIRGLGASLPASVQDTTAALTTRTFPGVAPQVQGANEMSRQATAPEADSYLDPRKLGHTIGQVGGSIATLATAAGPARAGGATLAATLARRGAPVLAARVAGTAAGSAGMATPEALQEAASVWNTVLQQTGDPLAADTAALKVFGGNTALLMATNVPLLERVRGVAGALVRSASEGGQEAAQQGLSNVATGRPVAEGMAEAATIGAVAAPVAAGIVDAAQRLRAPQPTARETPAPVRETFQPSRAPMAPPVETKAPIRETAPVVEPPAATPPVPRDTRVDALVRELNVSEDQARALVAQLDQDVAPAPRPSPSAPVAVPSASSRQGLPGETPQAGNGTPSAAAVQEPIPTPKARLREVLPALGFTAKADHTNIYRDLYRDAERQAKRPPTPAEMLAVVNAWAEETRESQATNRPGDRKTTLALVGRALRGVSQAKPAPPSSVSSPQGGPMPAHGTAVATSAESAQAPIRKPGPARPIAEDAVANGYPGTVEDAEADIVARSRELYDAIHEQDATTSGRALLREIASRDGINVASDPDTPGEARWLGEFRDLGQVNAIAGVRHVFRKTVRDHHDAGKGQRVTGKSIEDMAAVLREGGWQFESGDELLQAVAQVKRDHDARGDDDGFDIAYYAQGVGIAPGTRWWEDPHTPDWAVDAQAVETDEPGVFGEPTDGGGPAPRWTDPADGQQYEVGDFGPVFRQFQGNAAGAVNKLQQARAGEAIAALQHPDLGPIDLVWGEPRGERSGYGLAKIQQLHPEVVPHLGALIPSMQVQQRDAERAVLVSPTHRAAVALTWHGQSKTWLLTAYLKDEQWKGGKASAPAPERLLPAPGLAGQDTRLTTGDLANPSIAPTPAPRKPRVGEWLAEQRRRSVGDFERQGSPTRRPFFDAPSPELQQQHARAKPISEQQAVEQLRRIFAEDADTGSALGLKKIPLPTRMGKVMRGAFGHYEQGPRLIRLKRSFDLATFTHELGHHIDMAVFERTSTPQGLFAQELLDLGAATSPRSARRSYRLREGVAEYFRLWFANPGEATARAPQFSTALQEAMTAEPMLRQQLEGGQQVVQQFVSQSLAQRGAARISVTPTGDRPTVREWLERQHARWVDDLGPVRRAVHDVGAEQGHAPRPSDDAYVLARNAAGAAGKAQGFTRFGVRGRNGQFLSGSLEAAVAPVRERLYPDAKRRDGPPDFVSYLVALRAKEVRATGRDAGMTVPEADAILARVAADPQRDVFEAARDKVYAYQKGLLAYAREYGAFNDEQLALITQFAEHYVPLQRVIERTTDATTATKLANRASPVKRLKGSGRDIIDPIESIVKNTAAVVDMVEKNRAMQALARQARKSPGAGKWLVPVQPNQVATQFNLGRLAKDLREVFAEAGLDTATVQGDDGPRLQVSGQVLDLDELVTVFQPSQVGSPKDRIVTVVEKGERKFYQVTDEALYDALTVIGARPTAETLKWTEKPVQWLRAGVVLSPAFAIRNVLRDTVGAMIQSRHGFVPIYDTARGAASMIRKDADYQQFMTSGVQSAARVDIKRQRLRDEVNRLTRTPGAAPAAVRLVRHPIEALRAFSEAFETATRLGEFKLAVESKGAERRVGVLGITQRLAGRTSTPPLPRLEDVLTKATLDAADVTVDFRRGGEESKAWSRRSAFFNARVQGFARIPETVRRDPAGVALTMTAMAVVQAALWAINKDDEQYQELNPQVKRDYWVLRTDDRAWTFIPKPHEWAMVPNLVEAHLEWAARHDSEAVKELVPRVGTDALIALTGTAILPWLEVALNRDLYRGRPIVAPWKEKLDPELQDNEWTTDAARSVGGALGVSPAKLEHLIRQTGGTLASEALQAADLVATPLVNPDRPSRPSKRAEQLPVVGGLLRDPSASSRSASLVAWREKWQRYEQAKASVAELAARGDVAGAEARREQALRDLGIADSERPAIERASRQALRRSRREPKVVLRIPRLESVHTQMSVLSRQRAEAEGGDLSPDAKRREVDQAYADMTRLARSALGRSGSPSLEALGLRVK